MIRHFFRTQPGFKVSYHVKNANPAVRDRVNAVNGMRGTTKAEDGY
jgi:hypothetical protein